MYNHKKMYENEIHTLPAQKIIQTYTSGSGIIYIDEVNSSKMCGVDKTHIISITHNTILLQYTSLTTIQNYFTSQCILIFVMKMLQYGRNLPFSDLFLLLLIFEFFMAKRVIKKKWHVTNTVKSSFWPIFVFTSKIIIIIASVTYITFFMIHFVTLLTLLKMNNGI